MKTKDLIKYLSLFDPDANVNFIPVDLEHRLHYKLPGYDFIYEPGLESPSIVLSLGESGPLDDVLEEVPS